MPTTDQPSLLARIRALSERIYEYRHRFGLPRGHKDRYETHGAASGLQKLKQERSVLQGQLDPIRLIATGISCRDCANFRHDPDDFPRPTCVIRKSNGVGFCQETHVARADDGCCGPEAKNFQPKPCDMGVGCDEAGVCYAAAHGEPERCPRAANA